MSLSTKLEALLGTELAKDIIILVNSKNAMKKYAASEKGKAARKRASITYVEKHGRRPQYQNDTKEDVSLFLNTYVSNERRDTMEATGHTDTDAWMKQNPMLYRTGSEMWKAFQAYSKSKLTRIRFLTLLPEMIIHPFIMYGNRKVHTPAYVIPLMDYFADDVQSLNKTWGFHGAKSATRVLSIDHLAQFVEDEKRTGIHELLVGDHYRPYADLDYTVLEKIEEEEFQILIFETVSRGMKAMQKLFSTDESVVNFYCASSFIKKKISGHYIVSGMYYRSKEHIKAVMMTCDMDALHFDTQVYDKNKTMRLPLCSKPGEDRPLRAARIVMFKDGGYINYTKEDIESDLRDGLITHVDEDEDEEMPAPDGYVERNVGHTKSEVQIWSGEERTAAQISLRKMIAAFAPHRAAIHNTWTQGVWAIRRIAEKYQQAGAYRSIAQEFAKMTDLGNYSESETDDLYMASVRDIGVGYTRLKEWADADTPGWDAVIPLVIEDNLTFYDKKYEILASEPTQQTIEQWMLGCIRFCNKNGREDWYQHSTDGWFLIENKANFPFGTISSNTKFEKTSFKEILEGLKDTMIFQSCITEGAVFYPYYGINPKPKIINIFRGWPYHLTSVAPMTSTQLFIDHIMTLLGDAPGKYFLDTLTRKLLFPREKGKFIIMYGKHGGEGKNAVQDVLTAVFGLKHCLSSQGTKSILGQGEAGFNAPAEHALVVFIQEAKADGMSILCDEKFKSWLTEPTQFIRRMRTDAYEASNYSNAILFTNNISCIKMTGPMARRTMAVEVSDAKVGDKKHFDALWNISKSPEQVQQIFNYLVGRDISQFVVDDIPQTAFMDQMKEDSFNTTQRYIIDVCNGLTNVDFVNGEASIAKDEIYQSLRSFCASEGIQPYYIPTLKSLSSELKHLNITCAQKRIKGSTERCYYFTLNLIEIEQVFRKIQKNKKWALLKESDV